MSDDAPGEGEGRAIGSPVGGSGPRLEAPGKVSLQAPGAKVSRAALSPEQRVLADLGYPDAPREAAPALRQRRAPR